MVQKSKYTNISNILSVCSIKSLSSITQPLTYHPVLVTSVSILPRCIAHVPASTNIKFYPSPTPQYSVQEGFSASCFFFFNEQCIFLYQNINVFFFHFLWWLLFDYRTMLSLFNHPAVNGLYIVFKLLL